MGKTYIRRFNSEPCAAVCERCYHLKPQITHHVYLQSEIDEIILNAIAYVRNGFTCFDCGADLGSPLNIPFLDIEDYCFNDSPSTKASPQDSLAFSIPVNFESDSDVAIARWLLLQPRHEFYVPAWESIAVCNAIHWVLYALDHPMEPWDVERDKTLLSKVLTNAINHLETLNPQLKNFLVYYEKRHQSVFAKVKEILNDEPTE